MAKQSPESQRRREQLQAKQFYNSSGKLRYEIVCFCGNKTIVSKTRFHELISGRKKCTGVHNLDPDAEHWGWQKFPKNVAAMRKKVQSYQSSAKRRGYDWRLSEDEAIKLMLSNCHYCSAPPGNTHRDCNKHAFLKERSFVYSGIDRVDNTMGYTIDNCVPCCITCNRSKGTLTMEEWGDWINRLQSNQRADIGAKEPKEETPFVVNWPVYRSPKELFIN